MYVGHWGLPCFSVLCPNGMTKFIWYDILDIIYQYGTIHFWPHVVQWYTGLYILKELHAKHLGWWRCICWQMSFSQPAGLSGPKFKHPTLPCALMQFSLQIVKEMVWQYMHTIKATVIERYTIREPYECAIHASTSFHFMVNLSEPCKQKQSSLTLYTTFHWCKHNQSIMIRGRRGFIDVWLQFSICMLCCATNSNC